MEMDILDFEILGEDFPRREKKSINKNEETPGPQNPLKVCIMACQNVRMMLYVSVCSSRIKFS